MSEVIREWTLEDLPAVQHVTITTWLDTYASFVPEADLRAYFEEHYSLKAMNDLYHTTGVTGFVAERDSAVVAYVKTRYYAEEKRFYVSSLYVLPGYQGRGLGSKLMHAAEKCALSYGVNEVWLGVMTQNRQALAWYKATGFTFVEEQPFTMGRTTVPHLIGCRKIQQDVARTS